MKQFAPIRSKPRRQSLSPANTLRRAAIDRDSLDIAPPIVHEVLRSPGRPLDGNTRIAMESRFGRDFCRVRVHTGARAAESARAVSARAFAVGRQIVFAERCYAPATASGRSLIAHELAHAIQQDGLGEGWQPSSQLALNQPGDTFEQEADAAAGRFAAAAHTNQSLSSTHPMLQRQTPASGMQTESEEETEAGGVIVEGLEIVAEQAEDNNPAVRREIIDPIKDRLTGQWDRLSTGEQVTVIGFGAATLGMFGTAMLSDPVGRRQLEGANLATPLRLIPNMPLSSFTYTLPTGDSPGQRLLRFETSFEADDLINLRTESRRLPEMSLRVNMRWGYDPATDRLTVLGGDATLGLVPGLSLSGGVYRDLLRPTPTFIGEEGQITQLGGRVPEHERPQLIPDVRVMLNVDLLRFRPRDLARQLRGLF